MAKIHADKTCANCAKPIPHESGRNYATAVYCSQPCYREHKHRDGDVCLWSHIDKGEPNECWVYKGATDRRGYGRPQRRGKRYYAHRRSYEIDKGPIPPGMLVLHTCDNPSCCNPAHLYLGSDADNAADRKARGRGRHKYTPLEDLLFPHLSKKLPAPHADTTKEQP